MTFTLHDVAPWGRNLDEYCAMFSLGEAERAVSILGVGDGPASFNAEGTDQGMRIVSVDPLYAFREAQIRTRIDEVAPLIAAETRRNEHEFIWKRFAGIEELLAARQAAMARFLDDYETGISQGRYVTGSVSDLPFPDGSYDLALCSHFLFLYSARHDLPFHLRAVHELLRVAEEVRIFPLQELGAVESRHLRAVLMALERTGLQVERRPVEYEFQRGSNQMLVIGR